MNYGAIIQPGERCVKCGGSTATRLCDCTSVSRVAAALSLRKIREISQIGLNLNERFEGFSTKPYQDQRGVWTIGIGHTDGVGPNTPEITRAEADQLLATDMIVARNGVSHAVDTVFTTQNQYDAMVVLTFNIGVPGFMTSSVLSHHLKGEPISAMLAFPLWNKTHIDGKLVEDRGLMRRRICEAALYDTP